MRRVAAKIPAILIHNLRYGQTITRLAEGILVKTVSDDPSLEGEHQVRHFREPDFVCPLLVRPKGLEPLTFRSAT